ncbi:hypothetical protein B0I27_105184 [Arcticibacter pallidicorallinus]|uniref:Uncharacterized protein n=1 Tax=Arcticibacter pallidicorallinus TaxID=1259464 RepID=A0A2T0U468_9SPHI|nr:hypothetical protein B0I27_105184 [Arcticibacter pallidicorallinus]
MTINLSFILHYKKENVIFNPEIVALTILNNPHNDTTIDNHYFVSYFRFK